MRRCGFFGFAGVLAACIAQEHRAGDVAVDVAPETEVAPDSEVPADTAVDTLIEVRVA